MSKMKKTRKPGGGRKKLKPEYNAGKNLKEQMESAVAPQQDTSGTECAFCTSYQKKRRRESGRNGLGQSGR